MRSVVVVVALFTVLCVPLYAQDTPAVQIFGGYQLIHDDDLGESAENLNGVMAEIEGNLTPVFGIVGNFGYGFDSTDDFGGDTDFSQLNVMGGPRLSYRSDRFRVFGHALFGLIRSHVSQEVDGVEILDASDNDFGMAFGGGLDISLSDTISIRPVQFDFLEQRLNDDWNSQIRYSAGIVIKLGK